MSFGWIAFEGEIFDQEPHGGRAEWLPFNAARGGDPWVACSAFSQIVRMSRADNNTNTHF